MTDFLVNALLWTLALYGLFEIIKNIIYICTFTNMKADGIYLIIATKLDYTLDLFALPEVSLQPFL